MEVDGGAPHSQTAKIQHATQPAIGEQQIFRDKVAVISEVVTCFVSSWHMQCFRPDSQGKAQIEIDAVDRTASVPRSAQRSTGWPGTSWVPPSAAGTNSTNATTSAREAATLAQCT